MLKDLCRCPDACERRRILGRVILNTQGIARGEVIVKVWHQGFDYAHLIVGKRRVKVTFSGRRRAVALPILKLPSNISISLQI